MRLIDADSFRQWILNQKRLSKNYTLLILDDTPTVDATPVRHGAWERVEVIYPEENKNAVPGAIASMFCPVCKRWHSEVYFYGNPIERVNYCNHCGAKMDLKEAKT